MGGESKEPVRFFRDQEGSYHALPKGQPIVWRVSGYAVVMQSNKTVLTVIPKWSPLYELPGGGIEAEEGLATGIVRECYEETGYSIRIKSEIPISIQESDFYLKTRQQFCRSLILIFHAELMSDWQDKSMINSVEPDEIEKVEWIRLDEFNNDNTHEIFRDAICRLQSF